MTEQEKIQKEVLQKLYKIAKSWGWYSAVESYSPIITIEILKNIIKKEFGVEVE